MVNRDPLEERIAQLPNVRVLRADLSLPGMEDDLSGVLGDRPLYGVVHAAWPGAPSGGLLQAQDEAIERQLAFGTTYTIRLARLLASRVDESGGRMIAVGSIYGSQKPQLGMAAYSLGKTAMKATVRLLAPELARKRITINAVCPSFVPAGMNEQVNDRQRMVEVARVPLGRLCTTGDVSAAVRYLLAAQSAFVSGQVLVLSGAQL